MLEPRELPHSLEAEQSVLGAVLHDNGALDRIPTLRPQHFASADHRRMYQAMLDCLEVGEAIDIVTVADRLARNGGQGGKDLAYLGTAAANTPSASNVKRYAEIVVERARERELLSMLGAAAEIVHNRSLSPREKLEQIQAKVMAITEADGRDPVRVSEATPAYREDWVPMHGRVFAHLATERGLTHGGPCSDDDQV